jgi:hypothetical protein
MHVSAIGPQAQAAARDASAVAGVRGCPRAALENRPFVAHGLMIKRKGEYREWRMW